MRLSKVKLLDDSDDGDSLVDLALRNISSPVRRRKLKSCFVLTCLFCIFCFAVVFNLPFSSSRKYGTIVGWSYNTTRKTETYVLPNENTTLLEPENVCTDLNDPLFLLIVVCSSAKNFEARETIRATWGNETEFNYSYFEQFHARLKGEFLDINSNEWRNYVPWSTATTANSSVIDKNIRVKIVFLLGQTDYVYRSSTTRQVGESTVDVFSFEQEEVDELQLRITNESEVYGDIIQESFIDSYNNLTLKTIMMLKYVTNNCADKVKYIMKCDDDTFVNVPNLLHVLLGGTIPIYNATISFYDQNTVNAKNKKNRLAQKDRLLMGFLFCEVRPIADMSSKWYSPHYMYSGDYYPNYLSGTAYLMSFDTAKILYKASLKTPVFHLEDVYLTGIVASKVNLKRKHHPLFFYSSTKDMCALRGMISQHQLKPGDIQRAYDFITNSTILCKPPQKIFSKFKLQFRKKCQ